MEKYGREGGWVEKDGCVETEWEKLYGERPEKIQGRQGVKEEEAWRTCVLESNLCRMSEYLQHERGISECSWMDLKKKKKNTRGQCDEVLYVCSVELLHCLI